MYCSFINDLMYGEISTYETESYVLNKESNNEYQLFFISSNTDDSIPLVGGGLAASSYAFLFPL